MTIASKYAIEVAWRTIASNVYQLTRATYTDPATYRIGVSAEDINEKGKGQKEIGYYFIDWFGRPFTIIATDTDTIDVLDVFRFGKCPRSSKMGVVYKSDWKGRSLYLAAYSFRHLHPLAFVNAQRYFNALLWANDPNARRISFTNVIQPSIPDYTVDVICANNDIINPAEDYGKNPKFEIWQDNGDLTFSKLQLEPYITRDVDDNIISVLFSGTGDLFSGYILISK